MCGIAGFSFEDSNLIRKMTDCLKHRGPDDFGYYIDSHVSLGHRRLSIIDLSRKGRQPMSNEEGTVWITYNGEVYNYKEIKKDLKGNHKFRSNTDTEVLIHAYEEYGLDFLKKLRGMFALCVYDSEKKILILARDNIGKKPLYYHFDDNGIIFASEIKAILESGAKREINRDALHSYLTFLYTLGNQTIFEGIKKLMGGHYMIFDLRTRKPYIRKYWDIKEDILDREEDFFIKKLDSLLEESATLRLRSDVPVGAFLSGGVDSSSVVAYARERVDYDFHTFSMGFDSSSELDYARKVAEALSTKHHELVIYENDVIKDFDKISWHFDEPVGDPATVANYFLSKEASKYVKVVLAGEAGDEIFAGYDGYKGNMKYHVRMPFPGAGRKILRGFIGFVPLGIKGNPWLNHNFRRMNYISHPDIGRVQLSSTREFTDFELSWLLKDRKRIDAFRHAVFPKSIRDPLNYMLAIDLKNLLPEKYLMKAEKATMANSLEQRLVIMDRNIIEFSFQIPPFLKIRENRGKWILRKASEKKLRGLEDIVWRKKRGFGVPTLSWVRGEMKDCVLQSLDSEFIRRTFDTRAVRTIRDRVSAGQIPSHHHSLLAWSVFALERWHEQYF
jgi:asparagine synthase (glutamine-hydrolysing)